MEVIITLIANVSLALSFVAALVFGIAQVKASQRERKERLTLENLRSFQSRELSEALQFVLSDRMPTNSEEIRALNSHDRLLFGQFSQQMESLGILVAENYVDIDLVEKTLGTLVTSAWKKYSKIFLPLREQDPYIGEYFQWLSERIEEQLRLHPRVPFYKNKE